MITSSYSKIISYLQECYQSDNREEEILDIFDAKMEYCRIIEKKDVLFNGVLSRISLAGEDLPELEKIVILQEREKKLCLGFLLCTGMLTLDEKVQKICSPLLIGPAKVMSEGSITSAVTTELGEFKFNYLLFQKLANLVDREFSIEDLLSKLPTLPLNEEKLFQMVRVLGEVFPFLDLDPIQKYPQQATRQELKQFLKKKRHPQNFLSLFPASALLLIKRSVSTRGVLTELEELGNFDRISAPLKVLLGQVTPGEKNGTGWGKKWKTKVPAVLSLPQQKILANAARNVLSLVIGPPGTGKSFTIAAIALDRIVRGESVLIASKTNQAVDVIADKIETILGIKNFVIRGGRSQYLKDLKLFVKNLLSGINPVQVKKTISYEELQYLESLLETMEEKLSQRSKEEEQWGVYETTEPNNLFSRFFQYWRKARLEANLDQMEPYWELLHEYQQSVEWFITASRYRFQCWIRDQLRKVKRARSSRPQFRNFLKGIRSLKSFRQKSFFENLDFNVIFKVFPIWMVNQTDICGVLPLKAELFDIALIDEATQCDMASTLPVLQRARRAVIIGDPHQLRHISFLSRSRQRKIAEQAGLKEEECEYFNYRDDSILDLTQNRIENQENIVFLDEHFRSLPPLIRFSNREFYSNALKIMQERPKPHEEQCLFYHQVNGVRESSGINKLEAAEVLKKSQDIANDQAHRRPEQCNTIGILSPFAAQVEYLSKQLAQQVPHHLIQRHKLLVGTPYSFQGEERDIMLISLSLDKDSHYGAFHYFNRSDVFNVAITRARNLQIIYGSFDLKDPKVKKILDRYLSFIEYETRDVPHSHDPSGDPFLKDVRDTLINRGWQCWPNFPVAGFHVDLVVERDGTMMGIDLIGHPGIYSGAFELERYRLFNRAGFPIFPLSYFAWCKKREACLIALEKWLENPK